MVGNDLPPRPIIQNDYGPVIEYFLYPSIPIAKMCVLSAHGSCLPCRPKKGWGVIAKNLGIKPGSEEFHALKTGRLYSRSGGASSKKKHKGKGGK